MRSILQVAVLSLCTFQAAAIFGHKRAPVVSSNLATSVFGVSRGGGLFGGSKDATTIVEEK